MTNPHPKAAKLPPKKSPTKCSACNKRIQKGEAMTWVDRHWFHNSPCLAELRAGKPMVRRSGRAAPKLSTCGTNCPHCGGKKMKFMGLAAIFKQVEDGEE